MSVSGDIYFWGAKAKYVPEGPGIYAFYDKEKVLIYVGKSANLREEFTRHLSTNFSDDSCKLETKYYKREFTSQPDDRLKELLNEYREKHGKLPKCNVPAKPSEEEVDSEKAFHFYAGIGKPLGEVAFNLEDLKKKVREVPIVSLEFHQGRGDFARWIGEILENMELVEVIQKIDKTGEDLRREFLKSLNNSRKAACPRCGVETSPVKTWKMAGRPSRIGERLQLTIGYYKCLRCDKAFRRVLAKEKIKAS